MQTFPTLKDEARGNTARISNFGRAMGENTFRLIVEPGLAVYAAEVGGDKPRPKYDKAKAKAKNDAAYREKNRAAINAMHRARRAKASGKSAPFNPWLALAAPSSRSGIAAYTATVVSAMEQHHDH